VGQPGSLGVRWEVSEKQQQIPQAVNGAQRDRDQNNGAAVKLLKG
jgi:hypothetical protein